MIEGAFMCTKGLGVLHRFWTFGTSLSVICVIGECSVGIIQGLRGQHSCVNFKMYGILHINVTFVELDHVETNGEWLLTQFDPNNRL